MGMSVNDSGSTSSGGNSTNSTNTSITMSVGGGANECEQA